MSFITENNKEVVAGGLEKQMPEAEKRLEAADEKLKKISASESETEAAVDEMVSEAVEDSIANIAEEPISEEKIAEDTALNKKEKEVEKEEEAHTMTNSERIVVHIPVKSITVSVAAAPVAASAPVETAAFVPAPAALDVAPVEAVPVSPFAAVPVTIAPVAEEKVVAAPKAASYVSIAKAPVSEPKPVTVDGGYKIIDVTENYRNDVFNSAAICYGKVVTEGGWESEIEDDDDIVIAHVEVHNPAEDIIVDEEPVAETVAEKSAPVEEAEPAVAAVAVVNAEHNAPETEKAAPDQVYDEPMVYHYDESPVYHEEPRAAAPARTVGAVAYRGVPAPKNYDISEKYPAPNGYEEKKAAPVEQVPARRTPLVAPIPFTVTEAEYERMAQPEQKAKASSKSANDFVFDPNKEDAYHDYAEVVREENAEYGEHYDMHQIETEHLRYLTETKKLDKQKTKVQNAKKVDAKALKNAASSDEIRKNAEKSAAVVGVRMDYDARFGSSDLSIELLKFRENDYFVEKENKRRLRLISKIRKSIKKAKALEKKATKRYYGVLANESVKPTVLKNQKKQERLNSLINKLESLLRERATIDERLIHLYRGAETKSGGRVRARAEAKRYKVAKKVRNKLKNINRRLQKLKAPENLKIKIRYLLNTKIVSKSTLVYSKYMLKKLKPKGEARRELKRDVERSKKSLCKIDKNIRRMMKKAYKYDGSYRKQGGLFRWIIALIILAAIIGVGWYFFGSTLMGMIGLA